MKKVGVTGSTGFIGQRYFESNPNQVQLVPLPLREGLQLLPLTGLDALVHLAGKAHVTAHPHDPSYFKINTELTLKLAQKAKEKKVRHFIYMSSVKAESNDIYGQSKRKAEEGLLEMASPEFKVALIRPPLVYGPNVKANMLYLMRLCQRPIPLPFKGIHNARSMVFVDTLLSLVSTIIDQEAEGLFIAGDPHPLSTEFLVKEIRKNLHMPERLFSLPSILTHLIKLLKPGLYDRLFGSYIIDNQPSNQALHFTPPFSSEHGIKEMVEWFKKLS